MKSTPIYSLALAVLAFSMSALAATPRSNQEQATTSCAMSDENAHKTTDSGSTNSNDSNSGKTAAPSAPEQDSVPESSGQRGMNQDKNTKSRNPSLIEQQNKQWLHDLQGIYGG